MVHVCECNHHGFEHGGGTGKCYGKTTFKHATDKKAKKKVIDCACDRFKPGITLKEFMEKAHAA